MSISSDTLQASQHPGQEKDPKTFKETRCRNGLLQLQTPVIDHITCPRTSRIAKKVDVPIAPTEQISAANVNLTFVLQTRVAENQVSIMYSTSQQVCAQSGHLMSTPPKFNQRLPYKCLIKAWAALIPPDYILRHILVRKRFWWQMGSLLGWLLVVDWFLGWDASWFVVLLLRLMAF